MTVLKECPFCGNEVEVEKRPLWNNSGHGYYGCYEYVIECHECGCRINLPQNDTVYRDEKTARLNAINAWNKRAGDDNNELY